MITEVELNEKNRSGSFYMVMGKENWYFCDTVEEVASCLVIENCEEKDIAAMVSKTQILMPARYEQGKIAMLLEQKRAKYDVHQ